ncbi:MAG: class I adenylate-forming enzyme family protein [Chitinophagaceae bacterium]
MRFIYQLIKLRFLTPRSLLLLFKAKRLHGNNLCFLLKYAADRYAGKIAITDGIYQVNFKKLYKDVLNLSAVIHHKINLEGDSVAILVCGNSINHIITKYAIQNLGIKIILVNQKAHINEIIRIRNNQSKPCSLFSTEATHLVLENAVNIDNLITISQVGIKEHIIKKKYAAVIFPTSGTTGNAKLIEKKTGVFYWLRTFTDLVIKTGIYKKDSVYISIPVSHGFGYTALFFALVLGKKAMVTNEKDQSQIANRIIKEEIELLAGVPTSLYQIAESLKGSMHNICLVISGGAPLNEIILQSITSNLGTTNIFSLYGSTEASTSFIADYNQLKKNICALGKPLKGVKYRLEPLPAGGKELLIQSHLANISTDSWIHTGDLAEEDKQGYLSWCGRKDNMILKGGVNIYPAEIENEMHRIGSIEDVLVMGQKENLKGEIIIAFVKMKPATDFNEQQLKNQLKQFLPGIKIPDKIYQTALFEYTSTGKKVKPLLPNPTH